MEPEFELEVVDVLSTEYHQCGTRYTEIQLMSDGSVRSTVFTIPEEDREGPYHGWSDWMLDALT